MKIQFFWIHHLFPSKKAEVLKIPIRNSTSKHRGSPAPGSGRFTLNQIYSLIFEVEKGVMPSDFDAAAWTDGPAMVELNGCSNVGKRPLQQGTM